MVLELMGLLLAQRSAFDDFCFLQPTAMMGVLEYGPQCQTL